MTRKNYTDQELQTLHEQRERTFFDTTSSQRRHGSLYEPYDITHSEYRVLALLYFCGGCEPSVMADRLMILRQTMTKLIDSLEAKGYAVRTEHPSDRRKLYIVLLPEGKRIARELMCIESDFIDRVNARFTPEELETFHTLAARLQAARNDVVQELLAEREA